MTPKDIGEKFGIMNNSVTRLLRKNGIIRNQHHEKVNQKQIDYILDEYVNKQQSSEKIANELGIDGRSVCRVLKRNNIEIRSGSENKKLMHKHRNEAGQ